MYGRCISKLCSSVSVEILIVLNLPVSFSSSIVSASRRRLPNGVTYALQLERAQVERCTWCEGPSRKTRLLDWRVSQLMNCNAFLEDIHTHWKDRDFCKPRPPLVQNKSSQHV